ncbi:hypothetical protein [Secundilactobacillus oryzae]|uniref:hypothetical protein n=1 Tax=Secundilactobacillus oryzae TaxID=1202668 RepID=UPI000AC48F89|nr:hypothetical protein [Secundilactobacillus oryzae]
MKNKRNGSMVLMAVCFMTVVMTILLLQIYAYHQRQLSYHFVQRNYEGRIDKIK